MSENKRPDPGQDTSPKSLRESNIGLIVVLFLILVVGIGSGAWWVLRNGQELLGPEASTSAPLPQPTPTQATSEPQEPATPTQATSGPRGSATPTPPRASSRQPVPIKPRKFGDFEVKGTGSGDTVTYWTAKKDRFFIIGHLPGGSVEAYTKGLKGVKSIGGITCGTNDFGGYECFSQVHGGVGRTTMGPSGTLDELAEISRTFYEVWK